MRYPLDLVDAREFDRYNLRRYPIAVAFLGITPMTARERRTTNEWEFQGEVLNWLNEEIRRRRGMGLDKTTQEPSKVTPKRNDLVVWENRAAECALLTIELKTPETSITDPKLLSDADEKAKRWGARYFAIWNMQAAELYQTPPPGIQATPLHRIHNWLPDPLVTGVDDWLKRKPAISLQKRAVEILDRAWTSFITGGAQPLPIDASVFVERLAEVLARLRGEIQPTLAKRAAADRSLRKRLRALAAAQGFLGFVEDLDAAIAGQYTYRLIGQILFYFALRRKQSSLRALSLLPSDIIPQALRPYWDDVRRFDYEALFQFSELDQLVPVPHNAQLLIRHLIEQFSTYDWNNLRDDVLGAIFERLIPPSEQRLLGQFYTQPRVADVLVAFTVDSQGGNVLDPGCGSGTFLMRAYDLIKAQSGLSHTDLLTKLWGFDISPFAAELAAINLFRQDMSAFSNFPRIVPHDFFDRTPGEQIPFLPAKAGGAENVAIEIPAFSAIIGNPPYLRSQNQDDLDKNYKIKLSQAAILNGIRPASKTDLFAFFIYKALQFMRPGSRIGFVTSASWLTTQFGTPLQRLMLDRLKLVALIGSNAESFFSQVDVNTVLVVAEMRATPGPASGESMRFITLKKRLEELFPSGPNYWSSLLHFADTVEQAEQSCEDDSVRIKLVDANHERMDLSGNSKEPRNWSIYLRSPLTFYELFGDAI